MVWSNHPSMETQGVVIVPFIVRLWLPRYSGQKPRYIGSSNALSMTVDVPSITKPCLSPYEKISQRGWIFHGVDHYIIQTQGMMTKVPLVVLP